MLKFPITSFLVSPNFQSPPFLFTTFLGHHLLSVTTNFFITTILIANKCFCSANFQSLHNDHPLNLPMHKGFKGFCQVMFWAKFWFFLSKKFGEIFIFFKKFLFLNWNSNQFLIPFLLQIYNFRKNLHAKKMKSLGTWNHEKNIDIFFIFKISILCFNISLFKLWHSKFAITTN